MPEVDEVSKIRKEISRVYFFTMMSISFSPVYFFPRVSYVDASGTDIIFFLNHLEPGGGGGGASRVEKKEVSRR